MKQSFTSLLKLLLGWPLTVISFYFLWKIFVSQTHTAMFSVSHLNMFFVILSLVSFTIYFLGRCFLWQIITEHFGHRIPLSRTAYFWSISEIKRYVPGNIWSYLGRGALFAARGMTKRDLFLGFLLEAQVLVIASVVLSLPAIYYLSNFFLPQFSLLIQVVSSIGLLGGVTIYVWQRKILLFLPRPLNQLEKHVASPFTPHVLSKICLWGIGVFLFFGLGYLFSMYAFISIMNPTLLMSLAIFAFIVGYLSFLTPSGLGIREGMLTIALSTFLASSEAISIAILGRILLTASEVLALLITYMIYKHDEKTPAKTSF